MSKTKEIKQLYRMLPELAEKVNDSDYWFRLDSVLRDYLDPVDHEDAFNNLLLEMYRRHEHFTPIVDCNDSFSQKIYLIRLAYHNHKLKIKRSQIAEDIRILKYKAENYDLTTEEIAKLELLETIKKKL